MKKDEIIKENLDLLNEFMKIAFDQPDIMDKVPTGTELVILPENDPELYKANLKIKQSLEKKGKKCTLVKMKKPEKAASPKIFSTPQHINN